MALTGTYIGGGTIRWEITGFDPNDFDYFEVVTSDGFSSTSSDTIIYTGEHAEGQTVTGEAWAYFGGAYYVGSASVYIPKSTIAPIGAPLITKLEAIYEGGQHKIRVYWDSMDVIGDIDGYRIYANGVFKATAYSSPYTINVDYEYTLYQIEVVAYNSAGESDPGFGSIRTLDVTPPTIYSFDIDNITPTSARVMVEAYDSHSGVNRYVYYLNGSHYFTDYTSSSSQVTLQSLNPNTQYIVRVVVYDNQGNYTEDTIQFTTPQQSTRPSNFVWQYSTIASGQPAAIDHRDWNNLGARINQFRAYKGLPTLTFVQVSQGDKLYASYFNSFRNAIASMSPPISPPGTKVSGDVVYAADLNLLATSLNSIP